MDIDFNWLEGHIFCRQLTDGEQEDLKSLISVLSFKSGECIEVDSKGIGVLYLIRSGEVDVLMKIGRDVVSLANRGCKPSFAGMEECEEVEELLEGGKGRSPRHQNADSHPQVADSLVIASEAKQSSLPLPARRPELSIASPRIPSCINL